MKKELKWTFEVIKFDSNSLDLMTAYAQDCGCEMMANCYFTRPLYDENSDWVSPEKKDE